MQVRISLSLDAGIGRPEGGWLVRVLGLGTAGAGAVLVPLFNSKSGT